MSCSVLCLFAFYFIRKPMIYGVKLSYVHANKVNKCYHGHQIGKSVKRYMKYISYICTLKVETTISKIKTWGACEGT